MLAMAVMRRVGLLGGSFNPAHRGHRRMSLAAMVPIAILSRPRYGDDARAARAMGWLRHFVRPSTKTREWANWSAPAIIFLRLPPDPTSATGLRALDPDWHQRFASAKHSADPRKE